MRNRNVSILLAILFAATFLPSAFAQKPSARSNVVHMDRSLLHSHLRALGYRTRGGVSISATRSNDPHFKSLPHFSSSFSVGGQTYPYTMLGYAPATGKSVSLRSVIVPLRMHFLFFGQNQDVNVDFDPMPAVKNIVNSPIYQEASFVNGSGQFGDQMQRATFWNKMDPHHNWHVRMAPPRVTAPVDIEVTPETGSLFQISPTAFIGNVLIDFLDAEANTIIALSNIDADEVPIFVTDGVTAEALGYHSAGVLKNADGTETLQTYIFTSWLDPALVDPLFADISTLNHEEAEWINDPFVDNFVPDWMYPPPSDARTVCSGNPFLEVGDPQGNGPTFDDFPTVVVTVNGVSYHLQQLVMLPWFADEVPSSAQNGWYTFPDPTSLNVPAAYCP
jgi:hypothetical protein